MTLPEDEDLPDNLVTGGKEEVIWQYFQTQGIINKKVIRQQTLTNYRVVDNNILANSQIEAKLQDLDDIVVMNQHRSSQSQYTGTSTGRYARVGFGSSRSTSTTVGDVVFIYQGRPYIIFSQFSDPHGIVRLAKSAKKRILTEIKAKEKIKAQSQRAKEKEVNGVPDDDISSFSSQEFHSPDLEWQLAYPMVALDLIKNAEYDIKVIRWNDDSLTNDYNKMVIHSLEGGNCVEFRNKKNKNYSGTLLELKNLKDTRKIATPTGFLKKKEDVLLEFTFERDNNDKKTLTINVEDKFIEEIIDKIQNLKPLASSNFWSKYSITYHSGNGQQKTVEIFPLVPFLAEDEEIIWYNIEKSEGESKNNGIRQLQTITNFRVFEYNYEKSCAKVILLSGLEEPIITNEKTNKFHISNIGTLAYTRNAISKLEKTDNMKSKTVADIVFMNEGKPYITFSQISKPDDVVRLISATKEQFFPQSKLEEQVKPGSKIPTNEEDDSITDTIICSQCNTTILKNSKFCNKCGLKISSICSKCGNNNPAGSAFCNECGFAVA